MVTVVVVVVRGGGGRRVVVVLFLLVLLLLLLVVVVVVVAAAAVLLVVVAVGCPQFQRTGRLPAEPGSTPCGVWRHHGRVRRVVVSRVLLFACPSSLYVVCVVVAWHLAPGTWQQQQQQQQQQQI